MINSRWRTVKLEEIAIVERGKFSARPRNDPKYYGGDIPFLQTGDVVAARGVISSFSQMLNQDGLRVSKRFPAGTILITIAANIGDVAEVGFEFACPDSLVAIRPKSGVNKDWLKHFLITKKSYFRSRATQNAQANINLQTIKPLIVTLPPLSEQTAIADMLSTWDTAIDKTECLIKTKEIYYTWLVYQLISNSKHKRVHIRDFTIEFSIRNQNKEITQVLSVTNKNGFVLPEDQFERRVASSDLSNYKIVSKGQYAYNPSRINVGSIARLDNWNKGVLSPMYVVFKLNEGKVNSDYFLHWLASHEAKQRIAKSAQGSVRETVGFNDFSAIPFPLPSMKQQREIVNSLNAVQKEINLLKKQYEACQKQKRGLMQKLLTGKWRIKNGKVSR